MPSPDFSQYIDLTNFDVQPSDLYQEAVEYAKTALPEFDPVPGTLEDAMLQAGAYIGAATAGAINRLPDGLMEGVLRLMGVERSEATAATVAVEFELFTAGDTVQGDTVYSYDYFDGIQTIQYAFRLENGVTAGVGSTTVSATLSSLTLGPIPSLPSGTQLVPNEPSTVVFSCTTTADVTQGLSEETESQFLNRSVTYLQSLSATLNTASQIENYVLQTYADVRRCKVYDLAKAVEHRADTTAATNTAHSGYSASVVTSSAFYASASAYPGTIYRIITPQFYGEAAYEDEFLSGTFTTVDDSLTIDSTTGLITYTDGVSATASAGPYADVVLLDSLLLSYIEGNQEPGRFVVFVSDDEGDPVGRATRAEIEEDLAERVPAGLLFSVLDAWTYDLSFTITIGVSSGFGGVAVGNAVKDAIETLVSPDNWPNFNDTVRVYEIVAAASNVSGVDYVSQIDSSIPNWPDANWGNEKLVESVSVGAQTTGYRALYAGMLPRATVEVVTL